ncbi:MAG: helix-hairpin-helix domain-containing protein [Armatimonadota bacterium]
MSRSEHVALLGLGCALAVAAFVIGRAHRAPEAVVVSTPDPYASAAAARIRVHVVGEVTWPGLYLLNAGARVQDAIMAAHGPTAIADLNKVNLAAPLRDGDRVVIPRIVQPPYPHPARTDAERTPSNHHPPDPPAGGDAAPTVNVNTATAADLERLPGIGPVLARRIVEHREAKGLFRRLDDLLEVKGIGPKMLRRIQPWLRLDDGTEPARPP